MIYLDGINTPDHTKVTINGAWISVDGVDIRTPSDDSWYDKEHDKVMKCVAKLGKALKDLIV